jgi:hypothetical protein
LGGLAFEVPESQGDKECAEAKGGLFHRAVVIIAVMVVIAAGMPIFDRNKGRL